MSSKLIALIIFLIASAIGVTGLLIGYSFYMFGALTVAVLAGILAFKPRLVTAPPSPAVVATSGRRRVAGAILIVLGVAMIGFGVFGSTIVLSGIGIVALLLGASYLRK